MSITQEELLKQANVNISPISSMADMGHEQITYFSDAETGLKAIVAIHNTVLGPALGGTRVWPYTNELEALADVLRLSRGMTYKSAISGINLGGGKAVILADNNQQHGEFFWKRYGKFINSLSGKYITAEDVGTTSREMEFIASQTPYVSGKPVYLGGSGDPSPYTAYGVYLGMKASASKAYGSDTLSGKRIWLQGAGHVGYYLTKHLAKEGAVIYASDINEKKLKTLSAEFPVIPISPDEGYDLEADIYAPCALGGTLNENTIPRLKYTIIAGAANNQLRDERVDGDALRDAGIIYAPDFLINAGGVISCYVELSGFNEPKTLAATEMIYSRALQIFKYAEDTQINSQMAAIYLAEERIRHGYEFNSRM